MTLILWSGKNGEMMFNHRRCSRDRAVIEDILSMYAPTIQIDQTFHAHEHTGKFPLLLHLPQAVFAKNPQLRNFSNRSHPGQVRLFFRHLPSCICRFSSRRRFARFSQYVALCFLTLSLLLARHSRKYARRSSSANSSMVFCLSVLKLSTPFLFRFLLTLLPIGCII